MHLANMSLGECDALGYWRRALRRRPKAEIRAMSGSERVQMSCDWTAARRKTVRERLKRRRPAITEAAIRDMLLTTRCVIRNGSDPSQIAVPHARRNGDRILFESAAAVSQLSHHLLRFFQNCLNPIPFA